VLDFEQTKTKNLILKKLTPDNISQDYIDGLNNPEIVKYTEAKYEVWTKDKIKDYIRKNNNNSSIMIAILLQDKHQEHIGNFRIFDYSPTHNRAELSFILFKKSEWGKGYIVEALESTLSYFHETLGLHRICADYHEENYGSLRVFEKLGFKVEGIFKDHFRHSNRYLNSIRVGKIFK